MSSNDYHFLTRWRIRGGVDEVAAVIEDALALPRWWPDFFRSAEELAKGGAHGVGGTVEYTARGFLPYALRWRLHGEEADAPGYYRLSSSGDLEGTGIWRLAQDGEEVDVSYEWTVRANKPLLRRLSFLIGPIFAANHEAVMKRGQIRLQAEVDARRRMP